MKDGCFTEHPLKIGCWFGSRIKSLENQSKPFQTDLVSTFWRYLFPTHGVRTWQNCEIIGESWELDLMQLTKQTFVNVIPIQCPLSKPPLFTLFGQLPSSFRKDQEGQHLWGTILIWCHMSHSHVNGRSSRLTPLVLKDLPGRHLQVRGRQSSLDVSSIGALPQLFETELMSWHGRNLGKPWYWVEASLPWLSECLPDSSWSLAELCN